MENENKDFSLFCLSLNTACKIIVSVSLYAGRLVMFLFYISFSLSPPLYIFPVIFHLSGFLYNIVL